jgi:hypothetical protein
VVGEANKALEIVTVNGEDIEDFHQVGGCVFRPMRGSRGVAAPPPPTFKIRILSKKIQHSEWKFQNYFY